MRRSTTTVQAVAAPSIPRGWILIAAAIASWMLVVAVFAATTQLFGLVASGF
ncbi:MAG: hypothetical protein P0Y65_05320 [Candidatus Devosia phytovorans]|uniref:Uncharacterized protein n=1 Tax=Candidatus Devosia phytovorans TaxID=3121372 RepID=A0AAJ6B0G2_9HYPH|nr:hypothetical protein [Devosia sp.]WEK05675.1 MAG: hypothetical protein P0Y65_05320 [Devosia sp.]